MTLTLEDAIPSTSKCKTPFKSKLRSAVKLLRGKQKASSTRKASSPRTINNNSNVINKTTGNTNTIQSIKSNLIDLDNVSEADLLTLKCKLGLVESKTNEIEYDYDESDLFFQDFTQLPNLTVQVDNSPDVVRPSINPLQVNNRISGALFDEFSNNNINAELNSSNTGPAIDDTLWTLPKLKTPLRGDPISKSLANVINTACTTQCATDDIIDRYKIPENCEMLSRPLVNQEIWGEIDVKTHTYDKNFKGI
ncbi:hypothetical protein LOTGIDRAFT_154560 [Lottia gigantea]|uniref:Uncharacterized protein n=1 Tax=Lottia gigantea TaxID=225164 RepID=V3ZWS3_LOTGI|nr:hypothetical protein LOTGIDRAFT_154560 [Lottia gigantea]ESO87070.1 hypothetical protein LOTGIDRAFT_154560 [Lottia gigantea]